MTGVEATCEPRKSQWITVAKRLSRGGGRGPFIAAIWLAGAALFTIVYGIASGQGFISDDYAWISHGQIDGLADVTRIFTSSVGFYRPIVSLSFGLNHLLFGLSPKAFGLTNWLLAATCAMAIYRLARAVGLTVGSSTLAAFLWLFNFHGINMAVLWISGRTSLLLTLFSLSAVLASLRGRPLLAGLAAMAAMFSKEEAIVLPVLLILLRWFSRLQEHREASVGAPTTGSIVATTLVLVAYLLCRVGSGAMWPGTAPDHYRPVLSAAAIGRNVVEYADRSATFSLVAVILVWAWSRATVQMQDSDRRVVASGIAWIACGFAITLFLPVRSSLYAVFPSVGVVLIAATLINRLVEHKPTAAVNRLAWSGVALLSALLPVFLERNERWVELARVSRQVTMALHRLAPELTGKVVTIVDDMSTRANLTNAWAGATHEMSELEFGGTFRVVVVKPSELRADHAPGPVFTLRSGALAAVTSSQRTKGQPSRGLCYPWKHHAEGWPSG